MKNLRVVLIVIIAVACKEKFEVKSDFEHIDPATELNDLLIIKDFATYKIDVWKGIYKTYYMSGDSVEVRFKLTPNEKTGINNYLQSIIDLNINNEVVRDTCLIIPKGYTWMSFIYNNQKKDIQIDLVCPKFEKTETNINLRKLINSIIDIIESKSELKNVPKSDLLVY